MMILIILGGVIIIIEAIIIITKIQIVKIIQAIIIIIMDITTQIQIPIIKEIIITNTVTPIPIKIQILTQISKIFTEQGRTQAAVIQGNTTIKTHTNTDIANPTLTQKKKISIQKNFIYTETLTQANTTVSS